ncbi:MAG TPA: hypothetical protein VHX17_08950 [Candidatus Cybelea sp.]|nr:hypothetical protein [Candidatus Cybelea sp.]
MRKRCSLPICYLLVAIAGGAIVAGCSASSSPMPQAAALAGGTRVLGRLDHGPSWILPDAKKQNLLYVSDLEAQEVFIYVYGSKKLVGTLGGFFNPEGLCVDKKGDVWVTNDTSEGEHQIIEYAHGATTALKTLDDPDGRVNGCAIDPVTGDLAVTNFWGPTEGSGGVSIYPHGSGSPASYSDPQIYYYYYCGYDDKGDLFVDGLSYGSETGFAELPAGGKAFQDIALPETIYLPGGVQWDGQYMAVGDQVAVKHSFQSVIYQFAISGSSGSEVGATILTGGNEVAQFWLPRPKGKKKGQATRVIGPNGDGMNTLIWSYPNAGNPIKTYSGEQDATGATLSLKR